MDPLVGDRCQYKCCPPEMDRRVADSLQKRGCSQSEIEPMVGVVVNKGGLTGNGGSWVGVDVK